MSKTAALRGYLNGSIKFDTLKSTCLGEQCSNQIGVENIQWNTKISNFDIIDEIHFWGNQLKEHCIFLYIGLEDIQLKTKAWNLYLKWKAFMELQFGDIDKLQSDDSLHKRLSDKILKKIYDTSLHLRTFQSIFILVDDLRNLKLLILEQLRKKWIGWLNESFITHLLSELEYFQRKLTDVSRIGTNEDDIEAINESKDEAQFWVDVNSDHAAALSQLFDVQYLYDPNTGRPGIVTPKSIQFHSVYDPNIEDLTFPNAALVEFHSVFENIKSELVKIDDKLKNYMISPPELQSLYAISITKATDLDTFLTESSKLMIPSVNINIKDVNINTKDNSKYIRHIIHPLLFRHIKREGLRSIMSLTSL